MCCILYYCQEQAHENLQFNIMITKKKYYVSIILNCARYYVAEFSAKTN